MDAQSLDEGSWRRRELTNAVLVRISGSMDGLAAAAAVPHAQDRGAAREMGRFFRLMRTTTADVSKPRRDLSYANQARKCQLDAGEVAP